MVSVDQSLAPTSFSTTLHDMGFLLWFSRYKKNEI